MKNKKLKLNELKVQSFVTSLKNEEGTIQGGVDANSADGTCTPSGAGTDVCNCGTNDLVCDWIQIQSMKNMGRCGGISVDFNPCRNA